MMRLHEQGRAKLPLPKDFEARSTAVQAGDLPILLAFSRYERA